MMDGYRMVEHVIGASCGALVTTFMAWFFSGAIGHELTLDEVAIAALTGVGLWALEESTRG